MEPDDHRIAGRGLPQLGKLRAGGWANSQPDPLIGSPLALRPRVTPGVLLAAFNTWDRPCDAPRWSGPLYRIGKCSAKIKSVWKKRVNLFCNSDLKNAHNVLSILKYKFIVH